MIGKALVKGLDLLAVLAGEAQGLAYSELRARLDTSPASFARFLKILVDRKYVVRDDVGRYRLGWRLAAQGQVALRGYPLREKAHRHLRALVEETGESAESLAYEDGHFLFLDRHEGLGSVVVRARAGSGFVVNAATAIGRVGLAYGLGEGRGQLSKAAVARVRRDGYAELLQNRDVVYRIAAPVFDVSACCVGSLCLAAPAFRVRQKQKRVLRRAVTSHAAALSGEMGGGNADG